MNASSTTSVVLSCSTKLFKYFKVVFLTNSAEWFNPRQHLIYEQLSEASVLMTVMQQTQKQ